MIEFSESVNISTPPEQVFHFLAYIDLVKQADDSPVLALERTTSGTPQVGTKYREVVQILPFYRGVFLSQITVFEPPLVLDIDFTGPGMTGRDRYELTCTDSGTKLHHMKWVSFVTPFAIMEPLMRRPLISRLHVRLLGIKQKLEEDK